MICPICGNDFKTLGNHMKSIHKVSPKQYYDTHFKKPKEGICPVDSNPTRFRGIYAGYNECCCRKCSNIYTKPKRCENSLKKYGTEYPWQAQVVKDKIKSTNMERYGVENPQQNSEIRQRTEATTIKRYGGLGAASESIMNKMGQTNLERYGVKNVFAAEPVKEKIVQTNNIRFGVDYPIQNADILEKAKESSRLIVDERVEKFKETEIKLYGGVGAASELIAEKMRETNFERFGTESFTSSEAYRQMSQEKYGTDYFFQAEEVKMKSYATKKARGTFNSSKPEQEFYIALCELFSKDNVEYQYSDTRYPFACDFYIKSLDMFIELNLFWTHGYHWFDANCPEDVAKVEKWKSVGTKYYNTAIYNWTYLDLKKKKTAENNRINYVVLWNKYDINQF